jgi:DNA (cytosine-5)-methyltransferase 1
MKFGSVCSGIEAASVAWHPLGWRAAWLSEIEPFPSAVLKHHYPDVPNLGDMAKLPERILSGEVEAPDVFCGGTPCQAFSVAGLRKSLDDARGNLSLTFCEIANAIDTVRRERGDQPAIIFWENVPGVLSTKDNAFGCFLAGLAGEDDPIIPPGDKWTDAGCVFGPERAVAWRVLDAQYFGLAQRRRRVFVVASARDGFDPAKVLFEFDGVRRDSDPYQQGTTHPCLQTTAHEYSRADGFVCIQHGDAWRRLTPDEAECLQGFPRVYTAIPWRGKPPDQCPEGPRYKALGNSWAVPVVRWIGARINAYLSVKEAA